MARAVNGPVVVVRALVKEDLLRAAFLFEQCQVKTLDDDALMLDPVLAALDPNLDSVLNVNTAAGYEEARGRPAGDTVCFISADSEG